MAWYDLNWVDKALNWAPKGPECGHSGCNREVSSKGVCSRHKGPYGVPKPKNVFAEAEKARARKEAADARRAERNK
jgi:predicted NBD/HSP70 family sugar kinase